MFDYFFDIEEYMPKERFARFMDFARGRETPFLVTSLSVVAEKYDALRRCMPYASVYYAVKANPEEQVLRLLSERGSCFDIASVYELDLMLRLGVEPERLSFGNTIKKARDIRYAYEHGVRLFASDSESDVRKLAEYAPHSGVFFRILTDGRGADWPLSRKFGSQPDVVFDNIVLAKSLGLNPRGISFHVGSQQLDVMQWRTPFDTCKDIFGAAEQQGIKLDLLNIGGGFPAHYLRPVEDLSVYAGEITGYIEETFLPASPPGKASPASLPQVIIEPGRYMVGDAGVMVSEIVLISWKERESGIPWLYMDAGKFGGFIETIDECIRYPIYSERTGDANDYVIAGPTCDSMDILYEKNPYRLPSNLQEGDRLFFLSAGAYTQTYSSVFFNGFPPLRSYVIE
ncbi:MAG: type III PLP-dependent enzyme [Synergistaceae bacterium]|nr:type III PLP-dependent enzyme [Synergistaceae bacterium]